jgi:CheY-like chemotaxis protein
MVIVIVLITFILFIVVDILLRLLIRRIDRARVRKQRKEALDIGLKLQVSEEAKSLKRVEVPEPKARILAVDDEPIVLDSFRKILVLAGYSIDTVETGQEALGLIQKNDYDFVFTDLKMPEFDGLDVTKAVKHFRPDIDVIMITGYATVESAVDAMKFGAMDYVQKPFTEDELVAFVDKSLIRRQAKIEMQQAPKVHIVTASSPQSESQRVFNVPAGVFISATHAWIRVEMTGEARVGIDDFARKTIGEIDGVTVPKIGQPAKAGDPLFSIKHGDRILTFLSPVTGHVSRVNEDLLDNLELLEGNPYEAGWICRVTAENLPADLESLKIGAGAVAWYQEEIERFGRMVQEIAAKHGKDESTDEPTAEVEIMNDEILEAFSRSFLRA